MARYLPRSVADGSVFFPAHPASTKTVTHDANTETQNIVAGRRSIDPLLLIVGNPARQSRMARSIIDSLAGRQ